MTRVIVSETVHQENGENVHTIHFKAAPPEIVTVDGIECYIDRCGEARVLEGPAKGTLPGTYMYWLYLERWDKLPGRAKCKCCGELHIEADRECWARQYAAEVAECCGGRDFNCGHYGHGR